MEKFVRIKFSHGKAEKFGDARVLLGNKTCNTFAEWDWDGVKLVVTNDRYGFYPVYYLEKPDEIIVSPSISKLLEFDDTKEFNEDVFALILRLIWIIGDDTLFSAIKALPPASVLSWQNGKLKIDSDGIIKSKPINISRQEAIETYAELFQNAVQKTFPANRKFAVPISGGRDSRHILFELHKQNLNPDACLTIIHPPPRPNEDLKIAQEICRTLNLPHFQIEQSQSRFEAERRKNVLTGFSVYEHGWFLAMADFVKDRWNAVYDGIAGDVLSAGLFLTEEKLRLFEIGNFEKLAENILEGEGYIPHILDKKTYQKFSREKAVNYLCKELKRHADQPNPIGSFYFWNRTRRCVAVSPFRLFDESVDVIAPYLETELYDFLTSLPASLLLDQQLHTDTIAFAYPNLAHIPYENKNSPPVIDSRNFRAYSRDIFKYSLSRRNRILTNRSFYFLVHLRALLNKNYGQTITDLGQQAVHLLQLERL